MRSATILMVFVIVALTGFKAGGPRPPQFELMIKERDAKQQIFCEEQVGEVNGLYDPLNGYYLFEGENAEQMRECLKTNYGWFELGPPEYKEGTMAPPRF
jgi:hypothetical protein